LVLLVGGATGALLRYLVTVGSDRYLGESFPWGTLLVNLAGCFAIGYAWALFERTPFGPELRLFLFTGVLGAFTTFSTYGLESIELMRSGRVELGLLNMGLNNLLGLALVMAGFWLAQWISGSVAGSP
jgi:CrcB protein